jgi:serine-type D-Ala-D-Ala carboxypeptidase/endopeptidase (penicillin-binding protein 4)
MPPIPLPAPPRASRVARAALLLALLTTAACAPTATLRAPAPGTLAALGAEIGRVFDDTTFAHAHWGVAVRSLRTGETVHRRNGERLFVPASNMKLVTGAAVLEALGPEFRYRTDVMATGPVTGGVLRGDLVVRGGGDPTISSRFHDDARTVFRAWADSLRAHGVRQVAGAVVGIDEYLEGAEYGRGWSWDGLHFAYSAPVSGLQLDDASVRLQVFPGRTLGERALVSLDPPTAHLIVMNEATTVAAGSSASLTYGYTEEGALRVGGQVPVDTTALAVNVAVRDPARYFVTVLRETLREAGIRVDGPAVVWGDREEAGAVPPPAAPLFSHRSAPMSEIVPAFMKPSQNQMAEMLLRSLGRELRGQGTAQAGAQVVDSMFLAWNLPTGGMLIADGSGLSRLNYLSPDLLLALLEHMTGSPNYELWYAAQPVAGIDGTLRLRMRGTAAEGNVHAKTGTLSHVRALSGYVDTADGERLLFSMLVNAHRLSAADADRLIDAALARIAEFSRRS